MQTIVSTTYVASLMECETPIRHLLLERLRRELIEKATERLPASLGPVRWTTEWRGIGGLRYVLFRGEIVVTR